MNDSWKIMLGLGVLAYVVSPIDLIPDVAPAVGYFDDASLVALAGMLIFGTDGD